MEPGEKCICQEGDWHNAFGESDHTLERGMRLTVVSSIMVGGLRFYSFEETPEHNYYMYMGFKPLRQLN